MRQYHDLILRILNEGLDKGDRTGTGTRSIFGHQMCFDLARGFPLVTTKRVPFKSVVAELIWFLEGSTNNNRLEELGATIWREWANPESGELGPIYGKQWRSWAGPVTLGSYPAEDGEVKWDEIPEGTDRIIKDSSGKVVHGIHQHPIDQIQWVIDEIKHNPDSRRLVVSAWNVADLPAMALAPCHCLFQFYVADGRLSCHLYQRSADVFLGVPFNIASYALLTHMMAQATGLQPGDLVHSFGDAHLYNNHFCQAKQLLNRDPRPLPRLLLNPAITDIDSFTVDDVALENYQPHAAIPAPVAV